jgi:acyl dehydratase
VTTTRAYDTPPPVLPLYLRAALPALPVLRALPGIRHCGDAVPNLTLTRSGVRVDAEQLRRYEEVCGFAVGGPVPATYLHLSVFPLHLALMTETEFPFPPIGAVHVANAITVHRPLSAGATYDISVTATDLRPHPKGRLIDVRSTAEVAGETMWEETTTVLGRGKRGSGSAPGESSPGGGMPPRGTTRWRLPGDLGRRYAAVSGDRNPIHLYAATAKAFGFRRPIAHGMWTLARCLAALQGRLPDAYTVEVAFKKPVPLPSTVVFGSRLGGDAIDFAVTRDKDGAPHGVGRIIPTEHASGGEPGPTFRR